MWKSCVTVFHFIPLLTPMAPGSVLWIPQRIFSAYLPHSCLDASSDPAGVERPGHTWIGEESWETLIGRKALQLGVAWVWSSLLL